MVLGSVLFDIVSLADILPYAAVKDLAVGDEEETGAVAVKDLEKSPGATYDAEYRYENDQKGVQDVDVFHGFLVDGMMQYRENLVLFKSQM
jgi:hypothetical protein